MKAGAEAFIANKGAADAIVVTEEDKKIIDEVSFPIGMTRISPLTL